MTKELLPLEERIKQLEQEVNRLRKLLEAHMKDHGVSPPFQPGTPPDRPYKPDRPYEPDRPDIGPPKEF